MRLLDAAKAQGFRFERVAPGEDGPLWGERVTPEYRDVVYIGGVSEGCKTARARPPPLIASGVAPGIERVAGDTGTVGVSSVQDCGLPRSTRGAKRGRA